ncbi:MAG: YadA-like family protein [Novosphingobium sp.]|uniref:YadA family autotransporter adhesin n=1 Tax=Novosphingobium sp. TaxID=1874826 RepID=UPI0032BB3EC0
MSRFYISGMAATAAAGLVFGIIGVAQPALADGCVLANGQTYSGLDATNDGITIANGTVITEPTAVACGPTAATTGTNSTALGASSAAGQDGTAVGANASVTGTNSVALGQGSSDGGDSNVVSVGTITLQRRITNVAAGTAGTDAVNLTQMLAAVASGNPYLAFQSTGAAAAATGTNSAAIGVGAVASAPNSVALGTGSIANAANTVSVGSAGNERRVVNVAPGTISAASTDAVNGGQLYAVQQSATMLANQVTLNQRQNEAGIAAAMALGGTIMPADANLAISFNLATYRGEQGFSTAVTARASDHVYVSAGFSGSSVKGSTGARVGMTLAW